MPAERKETACGADVVHAICNAYPDSIAIHDVVYDDGFYYREIREEARAAGYSRHIGMQPASYRESQP